MRPTLYVTIRRISLPNQPAAVWLKAMADTVPALSRDALSAATRFTRALS